LLEEIQNYGADLCSSGAAFFPVFVKIIRVDQTFKQEHLHSDTHTLTAW